MAHTGTCHVMFGIQKTNLRARLREHPRLFWVYSIVSAALFGSGVLIAFSISSASQWKPTWLFVVLAVGAAMQPILGARKSTGHQIDAALLILIIAAVLLGPAPAVLIGVLSVFVMWLVIPIQNSRTGRDADNVLVDRRKIQQPRKSSSTSWVSTIRKFLHDWVGNQQKFSNLLANLADYTWFPLAAGLVFSAIAKKPVAADSFHLTFYLAFIAAYATATFLNSTFLLIANRCLDDIPLRETFREEVRPTIRTHEATLILAVITANLYLQLGVIGAIFSAAALYVYDRVLIQELNLRSRARELEIAHDDLKTAYDEVTAAYAKLRGSHLATVKALAKALTHRDGTTAEHAGRCDEMAIQFLKVIMGGKELDYGLTLGVMLHDVGKIGVPDSILQKPAKLTDEEWKTMKSHPQKGFEITEDLDFLDKGRELILHHHERYDGTGYPDGLKAEEIPIEARALTIVDSYDAMTSVRPYRKDPLSHEAAATELVRNMGTQFDPDLVELFIALIEAGNLGTEVKALRPQADLADESTLALWQSLNSLKPRESPDDQAGVKSKRKSKAKVRK